LQDAITLTQQLAYYKEYRSKLAAVASQARAHAILSDALYAVSAGTGDFIQNYYKNASLSRRYDVDRYCDLLVGIFSGFVDELYELGARRVGVTSLPPLGCLPASIRLYRGRGRAGCVPRLNRDAETFNRKLNATVGALKKRHADLKLAIFDIYKPLRDLAEAPAAQGTHLCSSSAGPLHAVMLCQRSSRGRCGKIIITSMHV
jgi:phospholipase/lecithinase/hemolysin